MPVKLAPLEALLVSGGDERIALGPQGTNKYGCHPAPASSVLSYSSSTASTISERGFAASHRLYNALTLAQGTEEASLYILEMNRIRSELITLCELETLSGLEVVLATSGTDIMFMVAELLRNMHESLLVIMPQESETGSGVKYALQGRGHAGNMRDVITIESRLPNGRLRAGLITDTLVEVNAMEAISAGKHVLLVLTDVSKTGLIIPSVAGALSLRERYPEHITILVDACQFRLSNATLRSYLEKHCLVAMTGSKFMTGPAFSAALLIPDAHAEQLRAVTLPVSLTTCTDRALWPADWHNASTLSSEANWGLLLRFEAALAEFKAFCALSASDIYAILQRCSDTIQTHLESDSIFEAVFLPGLDRHYLSDHRTWDSVATIFPFIMRHKKSGVLFTREETRLLYDMLPNDESGNPLFPSHGKDIAARRCMVGQPVTYQNNVSVLRLNIDMRLIVQALSPGGKGADAIMEEALFVLKKAALLAEHCFN